MANSKHAVSINDVSMEDNTMRRISQKRACNLNLCGAFNYFLKVGLEGAGLFQGKRTLLHRLMREMGFGYRHINNKCNYYEQPRIIEQRHYFFATNEKVQNKEKTSGVSQQNLVQRTSREGTGLGRERCSNRW